jgi:hypothetical protein
VGALNSAHIFGTLVPVEEPSTASRTDVGRVISHLVGDGGTPSEYLPIGTLSYQIKILSASGTN